MLDTLFFLSASSVAFQVPDYDPMRAHRWGDSVAQAISLEKSRGDSLVGQHAELLSAVIRAEEGGLIYDLSKGTIFQSMLMRFDETEGLESLAYLAGQGSGTAQGLEDEQYSRNAWLAFLWFRERFGDTYSVRIDNAKVNPDLREASFQNLDGKMLQVTWCTEDSVAIVFYQPPEAGFIGMATLAPLASDLGREARENGNC